MEFECALLQHICAVVKLHKLQQNSMNNLLYEINEDNVRFTEHTILFQNGDSFDFWYDRNGKAKCKVRYHKMLKTV